MKSTQHWTIRCRWILIRTTSPHIERMDSTISLMWVSFGFFQCIQMYSSCIFKLQYSQNEIPSAPSSSAYYSGSDFSGVVSAAERQYESIDNVNQQHFSSYDKNPDSRSFGGNTFITFSNNVISNRLSAITELQSSQMIRSDVNSDIVNSQYVWTKERVAITMTWWKKKQRI